MFRVPALLALTLPLFSQPSPALRGLSRQFEDLVDPAIVQIVTRGFGSAAEGPSNILRSARGSGTGVIVDPADYILTNAHVIGGARRVQVRLPQASEDSPLPRPQPTQAHRQTHHRRGRRTRPRNRHRHPQRPRLETPHAHLRRLRQNPQGQIVFAFGSPFGLENSATMGVVSSVARQLRPDDPTVYIQTDASINPGNSGGPLVDSEGRFVGINTYILFQSGGNEGVGFAAPSNIVRAVYEQIREFGRVRRGQISVVAQTITLPWPKPSSAPAIGEPSSPTSAPKVPPPPLASNPKTSSSLSTVKPSKTPAKSGSTCTDKPAKPSPSNAPATPTASAATSPTKSTEPPSAASPTSATRLPPSFTAKSSRSHRTARPTPTPALGSRLKPHVILNLYF